MAGCSSADQGTLQIRKKNIRYSIVFGILASLGFSKGQTIYVPIYSHIYTGDKEMSFLLTATPSIRNTDTTHKITIFAVDYYDSNGMI
ncbi:MAG: DUF3124 domain-containing protein [Proteobacteria bacterium]|nr:DUF3124 domain-containing protein [Pseudomonadota bacterium]